MPNNNMDSSRCTVVVLYQPQPRPYTIDDNHNTQEDKPAYIDMLRSTFSQVYLQSSPAEALDRVKQINHVSPTVFLIDLDALVDTVHDDDDSVYTLSCSSSCSNNSSISTTTDARVTWIKRITCDLDRTPIVVCSSNESTTFMLEYIHAGAADYLLKPLRLDVIKTLFLRLHRCKTDFRMHESVNGSSFPSSPVSCPDNFISSVPITMNSTLSQFDRYKDMLVRDMQFTKTFVDIYAPLPLHNKYIPLSSERAIFLKQRVSSWDFYPFDFDHGELIHCVYLIFEDVLRFTRVVDPPPTEDQLYDFIIDLSSAYHDGNPYHNFAHAVDVLQCLYYFLCKSEQVPNKKTTSGPNVIRRRDLLRPIDVFALLVAAIGHDVAHPGVNNVFLSKSGAPLALLYNDRSILENFHSTVLFQILKKHNFDQLVGGVGSPEYEEFRKTIITSILATDMALHNDYVSKVKDQANRLRNMDIKALDASAKEQERLLLCSGLIKCADISNVTRPFLRATQWAELLLEECTNQGDLERELGMPVGPLNDRDKVILEDSQIGFIRFVALELFQSVEAILPELSFAVHEIEENLTQWELRKHSKTTSDEKTLSSKYAAPLVETTGKKRSSSSMDYPSVEALHKRVSLESTRSGHSTFTKLPSMPTLAMRAYDGSDLPNDDLPTSRLTDAMDDEYHQAPQANWNTSSHDAASPMYCQCSIQ
ncbi:3',5'-cyclic-nucleotide phosphodiesterase [Apophysomyces ossiformis]|uniref:Phosphodiesterase n=1 Tax=Apophysomyces ossiformis TaxID=679940 RepID=A0A8H7BHZ4_9FUNG|nr:3',5'-cyclic-nucleotide phosphodiesterase [Apophysomyces ossiformis]